MITTHIKIICFNKQVMNLNFNKHTILFTVYINPDEVWNFTLNTVVQSTLGEYV